MTASNGDGGSVKDFYEDEKHLMKLCDFLRSSEGPPVREAVEMDKRVYYIKGAIIMCRRTVTAFILVGRMKISLSVFVWTLSFMISLIYLNLPFSICVLFIADFGTL